MMKHYLLPFFICAGCTLAAPGGQQGIRITKLGVQVTFEEAASEYSSEKKPGTTLWLQVSAPTGKHFIQQLSRESVTLTCRDGAGNSLKDATCTTNQRTISEDGGAMLVEVETPSVPSDGMLKLSGKIPATLSRGQVKLPAQPLSLEKGASASVEGYELEVSDVEQADNGIIVTLTVEGAAKPADLSFTTRDGRALETRHTAYAYPNRGGVETEYYCAFREKVSEVQVEISLNAGTENILIPVNTSVNLATGKSK